MNKSIFSLIITILLFIGIASTLGAQTTIGSNLPPAQGGLLQLKERDPIDPDTDNSNSDKGLGLPRVALKSLTSLEPFFDPSDSDYETQKILHQGLMVLNINKDDSKGLEFSPYTWDGAAWKEYLMKVGEQKLEVTPTDILFNFDVSNPVPISLQVEWTPSFIACDILLEHSSKGGLKGLESLPNNTDISGNYTLSIAPAAMTAQELEENPFLERNTDLYIRSSDGAGKFITKTINLNQINYSLTLDGLDPYMEMGREYTLTVASNTPWKLSIDDATGGAFDVQKIPTDGSGTVDTKGVKYKVKLKQNDAHEGKQVKLVFSSIEGKFTNKEFVFKPTKTYPNSYIVKKGALQAIPLKKAYIAWANDLKDPLPEGANFDVEVVWQDTLSLINTVTKVGSGIETNIIVTTNTGPSVDGGNALIAAKLNGEICWSWHLWVTKYDPNLDSSGSSIDYGTISTTSSDVLDVKEGKVYSYFNSKKATQFMDRDLGALRPYGGEREVNVYGMYFEYGRKDPFPAPDMTKSVNSTYNWKPWYALDNTPLISSDGTPGSGVNGVLLEPVEPLSLTSTLPLAIKNPTTYYYPETSTNDFDWYASFVDCHKSDAWEREDGSKGLYDPCPEGWRVPTGGLGADNPYFGIPFGSFTYDTYAIDTENYIGQVVLGGNLDLISMKTGTGAYVAITALALHRLATPVDARSYSIQMGKSTNNLSTMNARGHGFNLRCVKDYGF